MKRTWFEFKTEADATAADIYVFDLIGDWIDDLWGFNGVTTAKSFVDELAKLPASVKTLRVHINSPGGDIFGGITIANTLRAEQAKGRTVETIIEGLAASAASIIAMGGNPVRMADNGILMVHAPWSVSIGNATEMREVAKILDQLQDTLVKTYQWHSQLSDEDLVALIDGETHQGTWLDADAAIAAGLVTEKVEGLKAAATIDRRSMAKLAVPEKYRARVDALLAQPADPPAKASAAEVLALCAEAKLDLTFAHALVASDATLDHVRAKITEERQRKAQAKERETQITALCVAAKQPADRIARYIKSALSIDEVKADLATVTALVDNKEIDGSLPADMGGRPKSQLSASEIYAARSAATT